MSIIYLFIFAKAVTDEFFLKLISLQKSTFGIQMESPANRVVASALCVFCFQCFYRAGKNSHSKIQRSHIQLNSRLNSSKVFFMTGWSRASGERRRSPPSPRRLGLNLAAGGTGSGEPRENFPRGMK